MIGNFNTFFGSFAAQSTSLQRDGRRAAEHAAQRRPRPSPHSTPPFPPTRTFALDIIPGVEQTPATVKAALPWIEQVQASLAPNELGGVAKGLREAAPHDRAADRPNRRPSSSRPTCSASA